jgi:hypothetical protein
MYPCYSPRPSPVAAGLVCARSIGSPLALELGLDVLRGNGYGMDDNLVQR